VRKFTTKGRTKKPMIASNEMFLRGWGFPAVECEPDEPGAVLMYQSKAIWVKPQKPAMLAAWQTAGSPEDPDSWRFYGAIPASENV
jgi:hypothetical protein